MIAFDVIRATGHNNVKGTHRNTLEITKDDYLTPRGDCIIGINADKALSDLKEEVKSIIKKEGSFIYVILKVKNLIDIVEGRGSLYLPLSNSEKIIVRRSNFISDSTIMIHANKAAKNIRRDLINELRKEEELISYVVASDSPLKYEEILGIVINSRPDNRKNLL
ncbi:DUF371 domain-containing protein [Sulfuracidifex metallicus]|uniref:DUF371 domain-containing protein n=1 Tax=Sulfuracidifex metallicus DSM 6482 = JCM 9184 TaxID=523847 RepID=A0A6A9QNN8_SULME|nr:DUF371 domain-containing protein [Sulfuracidifex metallicus]MUN29358.1 DUF371 domain-containing protein [Sulfuracidifex metallicus DSM 6482 = JCM 9184]WOE50130.1 DUF371 domain-containing protein [Sulfuracidifex metallicus DSM 6482 = JCM 9184]